jgi:hypothetical protein
MSATAPGLLDTDMLSEVMRARDPRVREASQRYLTEHGHFTFSIRSRETSLISSGSPDSRF